MKKRSEDVNDGFYEEIKSVYKTSRLHCTMMTVGDINAKIGKE